MKEKFLIIATIALMFGGSLCAQEKKQILTPEQRLDMFVVRMQNKLMLDDATAAKFAPVYKEYLQAKAECCKPCAKCENPTDAQIKEKIEQRLDARQKALDVEKKYFKKLSTILNGRQLQQVFCNKKKGVWSKGKKGACGKKYNRQRGGRKACPMMQGNCPKASTNCPKAAECPLQTDK